MKTPQQSYPKLAQALGISEVYLKREDLHKYGSHKGRSLPLMIKQYAKEGVSHFVISSSGNAALAAIQATIRHNTNNRDRQVTLRVLVGQKIDQKKLQKLQKAASNNRAVTIEQVERPKQTAFQVDKEGSATFLRQSTDDLALEGYLQLAEELNKIPNLEAVFVPTSSGTTAQAVSQAFREMEKNVQIHVAQTTACYPIAEVFDAGVASTETSLAGAIVDKVAHRKDALIEAIKTSNGSGWVIDDAQLKAARQLIKDTTGIVISYNSALSVAALQKSLTARRTYSGPVACLITGA